MYVSNNVRRVMRACAVQVVAGTDSAPANIGDAATTHELERVHNHILVRLSS